MARYLKRLQGLSDDVRAGSRGSEKGDRTSSSQPLSGSQPIAAVPPVETEATVKTERPLDEGDGFIASLLGGDLPSVSIHEKSDTPVTSAIGVSGTAAPEPATLSVNVNPADTEAVAGEEVAEERMQDSPPPPISSHEVSTPRTPFVERQESAATRETSIRITSVLVQQLKRTQLSLFSTVHLQINSGEKEIFSQVTEPSIFHRTHLKKLDMKILKSCFLFC